VLHGYRVIIRRRDGNVATGFSPIVDANRGVVRWAAHVDGGLCHTLDISRVLMLVLTRRTVDDDVTPMPDGDPVSVRFGDGSVVSGVMRPVPLGGGLWFRPDSATGNDMLMFVPNGAAQVAIIDGSNPRPAWAGDHWLPLARSVSHDEIGTPIDRAQLAVSEVPMDPPTPSAEGFPAVNISNDETLDESGVFE